MRNLVDQVIDLLAVTPDSIARGSLTFHHGPLHSTLWIWKDPYDNGLFGWSVTTYDTALSSQTALGGPRITIHHPQPSEPEPDDFPLSACYPWPVTDSALAPSAAQAIAQYGPPS